MRRLIGGILLAIGILVAGASGLCTITFVITMITSAGHRSGAGDGVIGGLGLVAGFGGIPFLIGIGLFLAGRSG